MFDACFIDIYIYMFARWCPDMIWHVSSIDMFVFLLSQTLVPGAILKGGQDTTRARKIPENKCEGFLHGSLSRVGMIRRVIQVAQITLPIHPDNPHLTTTTRHVMVGITRSKVIFR